MNYRESDILAEKAISADITETIDLDIAAMISRLDVTYRCKPSVENMSAPSHKCVTKIEVVDGSDVLYSLDGGQIQALNIYDRKVPTMGHGQHVSGLTDFQTYGVDFGRYLWDRELAFDPTKFNNPQLKVTLDVDAIGGTPTAMNLRVRGNLFDEKAVTPVGFLMAKEHYSYTPASSDAYEYVELPKDYLIKRMMVQAYKLGYEPWYQITEARLDENNEARIPFDVEIEDYGRRRKGIDPEVEELFVGRATTGGYTYYTTPTDYYAALVANAITAGYVYHSTIPRAGKFTVKSSESSAHVHGIVRGIMPNHCINFPFGDQNDMADWYDTTKLAKARLRLKSGAGYSSSNINVVLQQYRPY